MECSKPASVAVSPRLVFGVCVMMLGLMMTLETFGIVQVRRFFLYWPVLLIALGIVRLVPALRSGRADGWAMTLFGVAFLLNNLDIVRLRQMLPLFILALGATMVLKAVQRGHGGPPAESSSAIDAFAFMSGVQRASSAQAFSHGSATAIMGGVEIDLTRASVGNGGAVFDTFAFWGGIEIKVPPDWLVEPQGLAVLGGFVDSTKPPPESAKRLVITGLAVMGGVEVKN